MLKKFNEIKSDIATKYKLFGKQATAQDAIQNQFTPRDFVSGFIPLPIKVKAIETAWHAASVALDTEKVRLAHKEADGGVYFIAAPAAEFVTQPHAVTPLYSAIPGTEGHQGDGAYFHDIGGGIMTVIVKEGKKFQSYSGEKSEVIKFAGNRPCFHPMDCGKWIGYREFELREANKIAMTGIALFTVLTLIFTTLGIRALNKTAFNQHAQENSISEINARQLEVARNLNSSNSIDVFADYKRTSAMILKLGGNLIYYDFNIGSVPKWEASFPFWIKDLSELGNVKVRFENKRIIANKG